MDEFAASKLGTSVGFAVAGGKFFRAAMNLKLGSARASSVLCGPRQRLLFATDSRRAAHECLYDERHRAKTWGCLNKPSGTAHRRSGKISDDTF